MKRVLILGGDSYVGQQVARTFHQSHEYEIDVTLSRRDEDLVKRQRQLQPSRDTSRRPCMTVKEMCAAAAAVSGVETDTEVAALAECVPTALSPFIDHVIPRHNDDPEFFCQRLLENDIIIAVLEDDSYEAECAIKVLAGSHYEVEKTFVLVSSALTWANTRMVDVARVRAERRKAREDEIAAFREEMEDEVDENGQPVPLPESLSAPLDEETEIEIAEARVEPRAYTEDDYASRVPHPRYQHWRLLEHLVKHANSQTLHTYVVFAGLPYGHGEGPLQSLLRSAWHNQSVPMFGPGDNVIPMIHVEDLANIVYKLGSAYDVYDERYLVATDRGQVTQRELLHIIANTLGGAVEEVPFTPGAPSATAALDLIHLDASTLPRPPTLDELRQRFANMPSDGLRMPFFLSDIRLEPGAVLSYHEEEDWVAVEGFAQNIHKVTEQFRVVHGVSPTRIMLTGPPLSGKEGIAESLAAHYQVPLISAKAATAAFEIHAEALREKLVALLATRLKRRRDRVHARRVAEFLAEQARQREEKLEARRQRRAEQRAANDDDDDDQEDEEDEEESEEDEENSAGDDETSHMPKSKILPMFFPDDRVTDVDTIVRRHRYLLGLLNESGASDVDDSVLDYILDDQNFAVYRSEDGEEDDAIDGDGEVEDEEMEEEDVDLGILEDVEVTPEEELDPDLPRDEQGPSRAQARARLAIRRLNAHEEALIKSLRQSYVQALKVLSMRVVSGHLPRPRRAREFSQEDEDADDTARHAAGSPEEEEEEEGEEQSERDDHGDGDQASDNDEETDDDSDSDSPEDKAEAAAASSDREHSHHLPHGGRYLDEAIAFMLRWRLRQVDCANRGFVLLDFPRTVQQAFCLFYTSQSSEEDGEAEAEAAERMAKRARPLTSVEDVIAPEDDDYPFLENFIAMDAESRQARESELTQLLRLASDEDATSARALHARRLLDALQKAGFNTEEEGLLAPVCEAIFPNQLVLLRDGADVLQLRANAVSTAITEAFQIEMQHGTVKITAPQGTNAQGAAGSGTRVVKQLRQQQQQQGGIPTSECGEWSFSMSMGRSTGVESNAAEKQALTDAEAKTATLRRRALRLVHKLSAPFHRGLRDFQTQFSSTGGPAESVLTWLQSVATTERLGATPAPVIATKTTRLDLSEGAGAKQGDDDEDAAATVERLEAPRTSRTMRIVHVQAPTRTTMDIAKELFSHCYFTEEVMSRQARELFATLHRGSQPSSHGLQWLLSLKPPKTAVSGKAELGISSLNERERRVMAMTRPYAYEDATERLQMLIAHLPSSTDVRVFLAEVEAAQQQKRRHATGPAPHDGAAPTASSSSPPRGPCDGHWEAFPPLVLFTGKMCVSVLSDVHKVFFGPPTRVAAATAATTAAMSSAHETLRDTVLTNTGSKVMPAMQSTSRLTAEQEEEKQEMEWIAALHAREQDEIDQTRQAAMDVVKSERLMLRSLQVHEACQDADVIRALPMETYLMTYVLPSLTPALTQITKERPEKPVTALADILFEYKRRLEI